eukprot:TRINITY_DN5337_c0_g1_i2.p1 TRINITY_DN5337_c0_g1~~TRINITY_DN5337_c0_g1_i2.p1  ORF type:complete len:696 (+),score=186.14 TRINITY_DN5337_c0_g1_i2:85-2172(+)
MAKPKGKTKGNHKPEPVPEPEPEFEIVDEEDDLDADAHIAGGSDLDDGSADDEDYEADEYNQSNAFSGLSDEDFSGEDEDEMEEVKKKPANSDLRQRKKGPATDKAETTTTKANKKKNKKDKQESGKEDDLDELAPTPVKPAQPETSWISTILFWGAILAVVGALCYLRFYDSLDLSDLEETDVDADSDYYQILNIPRDASITVIRTQYKKLALQWHPDKCEGSACQAMFAQISRAYEVLSDADKRRVYDSTRGQYEPLPSEAVELTPQNFHELVVHSDFLWIIQVYEDLSGSSRRFASIWEREVSNHGGSLGIRFGRLHMRSSFSVISSLPLVVRTTPTLFSYLRTRLQPYKPYLQRLHPATFQAFIRDEFPVKVPLLRVAELKGLAKPSVGEPATLVYVPRLSASTAPNPTPTPFLDVAFYYRHVWRFVHVRVTTEKEGAELDAAFPGRSSLPALLLLSSEGPKWLKPSISKSNLATHLRTALRLSIPQLVPGSYEPLCTDAEGGCVLLLKECANATGTGLSHASFEKQGRQWWSSHSDSRLLLALASAPALGEASEPLCQLVRQALGHAPSTSQLIALTQRGQRLHAWNAKEQKVEEFFESLLSASGVEVSSHLANALMEPRPVVSWFSQHSETIYTSIILTAVFFTFVALHHLGGLNQFLFLLAVGSMLMSFVLFDNPIVKLLKKSGAYEQ